MELRRTQTLLDAALGAGSEREACLRIALDEKRAAELELRSMAAQVQLDRISLRVRSGAR
jgi:hypothetical protein